MRIKKITEESSRLLIQNLKDDYENLKDAYHEHSTQFTPLTDGLNLIQNGSYQLDDNYFYYHNNQMKLETDGAGKYDFQNAKMIYELFDGLTASDANDARFWVRLTHDHCHEYVVKRWMGGKQKTEKTIIERFFFEGRAQSARVRNGIARLWWIAYLTVQPNAPESEKWKYTEAICESQDFITSILERTIGTYPNVRFGILEYYLENKKEFEKSKSKKIQQILRDINNFGGVNLLPLLSKEKVKEIIKSL